MAGAEAPSHLLFPSGLPALQKFKQEEENHQPWTSFPDFLRGRCALCHAVLLAPSWFVGALRPPAPPQKPSKDKETQFQIPLKRKSLGPI